MNQKIIDFIKEQFVFTLGVCDENGVYSASCFYIFDDKNLCLIFRSDAESKHIKLCILNPNVAVSIIYQTKKLQLIKGVQIKAIFREASLQEQKDYYQHYPFAKISKSKGYALDIFWAKYTDNSLLIPKKIEYQQEIKL